MDQKANAFLAERPIGNLMRKYAVPCVISAAFFRTGRCTVLHAGFGYFDLFDCGGNYRTDI